MHHSRSTTRTNNAQMTDYTRQMNFAIDLYNINLSVTIINATNFFIYLYGCLFDLFYKSLPEIDMNDKSREFPSFFIMLEKIISDIANFFDYDSDYFLSFMLCVFMANMFAHYYLFRNPAFTKYILLRIHLLTILFVTTTIYFFIIYLILVELFGYNPLAFNPFTGVILLYIYYIMKLSFDNYFLRRLKYPQPNTDVDDHLRRSRGRGRIGA